MPEPAYPPDWDDVLPEPEPAPARKLPQRAPRRPGRDHVAEWRRRKLRVYNKACDLRDKLRAELGGKCSNEKCGATMNLEFHHPHGRDWEPRKQNLLQRMRLYWRDHESGRLALLCSPCNGRDGAVRGYWQRRRSKQRKR